jgi:dTDP-4-amino-4,6-dideoxygalactose transaminase
MTADAWQRFSDDGYRHYLVVEAGFKYNMTDMQAALGLHQLARLDANHARRTELWERYDRAFAGLPCLVPAPAEEDSVHARHLYTLLLEPDALTIDRDRFLAAMHAENVGTGVHFVPVHLHPFYQDCAGSFPNAESLGARTVSLPLSAKVEDRDADDVIAAVTRILTHYRR